MSSKQQNGKTKKKSGGRGKGTNKPEEPSELGYQHTLVRKNKQLIFH